MSSRISSLNIFNKVMASIQETTKKSVLSQTRLSSGKRVESATDDPIAFPSINTLSAKISTALQYQKNIDSATTKLASEEAQLSQFHTTLFRIRSLILQSDSDAMGPTERQAIAAEMGQLRDELVQIANSKGADGEYVFSGYKSQSKPFVLNQATGQYDYNGDQGQNKVQVAESIAIPVNDSGFKLFHNIQTGNGDFVVDHGPVVNAGTGTISVGSVTDRAAYTAAVGTALDTYTITFALNGSNQLIYDVDGATAGNIVNDALYTSGAAITFLGMTVEVSGTPVAADRFRLLPSAGKSVFAVIKSAVDTTTGSTATEKARAIFSTNINVSLSEIDNAIDAVLKTETEIGTRVKSAKSLQVLHESSVLRDMGSKSVLEDVDYAAEIANYAKYLTGLTAAYESFSKIESLNLFKFI